jgi:hypothetical protein
MLWRHAVMEGTRELAAIRKTRRAAKLEENNLCSVVAERKGILPTNKKSTSQLKTQKMKCCCPRK